MSFYVLQVVQGPIKMVHCRWAKAIPVKFITAPFTNVGTCDVSNIIEIEAQESPKSSVAAGRLSPLQAVIPELIVVDTRFPVLGVQAPGCCRAWSIVMHLFLQQLI